MKRIDQVADVLPAITPVSNAAGAVTGIKIDGTGYRRARFTFQFGANGGTSAAISAGVGVWQASTSGATFASNASAVLAAVSSGVLSNNIMVIDMLTSSGTPWLLVSGGSVLSTAIVVSCTCELYGGYTRPPATTTPQQVVTVS